jgi:rSAM/selenodomain-associated transferase 1
MLYIAARAPRPGFTKTRLGRAIGYETAATLYAAFLADLARRFRTAPFGVGWFVTPSNAWPEIAAAVCSGVNESIVIPQPDGDWATRQRALFADLERRRERRTVLIASDSPQIDVEQVQRAFDLLERHDLVLGPVYDGGYYLIGMRDAATATLLDDLPMSDGDVLTRLVARARARGDSVGLAEPTYDVDEVTDLERLCRDACARDDLSATRAALRQLGLLPSFEPALTGREMVLR